MQAKLSIPTLILCAFTFLILIAPTAYSDSHAGVADFYESYIVKKIKNCDSKSILLRSSRSKNLRAYAMMEAQKAAFLSAEKETLVNEMVEMKLNTKDYKVELYLNNQFLDRVHHRK